MKKNKDIIRSFLIWSISLALFLTLEILPSKLILLQFQFITDKNEDTGTEKAIVADMSEAAAISTGGGWSYNEEKDRYEYLVTDGEDGSESYCNVIVHAWDFFRCKFRYRLKDEDETINPNDRMAVTIYKEGRPVKQEIVYLSEFDSENGVAFSYDYSDYLSIIFSFLMTAAALNIVFAILGFYVGNRQKGRIWSGIKRILKSPYINLVVFAMAWLCVVYAGRSPFIKAIDTGSYMINSIDELRWHIRMPIYQLVLLGLKTLLHLGSEEHLFVAVSVLQRAAFVISILFFYEALKKILKNEPAAFCFSLCYTLLGGVYGYTELILTESLAMSLMTVVVWLIAKLLETEKRKYMAGLNIMIFLGTMLRPSFVFLYPMAGIFILVHYFGTKNKRIFTSGILSFVCSVLLILAYCEHNKMLTGCFMLSGISVHNQTGIVIMADIYDHPEYPDYTRIVDEIVEEETPLHIGTKICEEKGYDKATRWEKACKRQYRKQYVQYLCEEVQESLNESVIELNWKLVLEGFQAWLFEGIRMLLLPLRFGTLLVCMIMELAYCLYVFVKRRIILFLPIGITGCILCGYLLSVYSLIAATLQRYMVHLLPLYVMFEAILVMQIVRAFMRKVHKKRCSEY